MFTNFVTSQESQKKACSSATIYLCRAYSAKKPARVRVANGSSLRGAYIAYIYIPLRRRREGLVRKKGLGFLRRTTQGENSVAAAAVDLHHGSSRCLERSRRERERSSSSLSIMVCLSCVFMTAARIRALCHLYTPLMYACAVGALVKIKDGYKCDLQFIVIFKKFDFFNFTVIANSD